MIPLSLSRRAAAMQSSPIRKLEAVAQRRKKEGVHVYYVNIGQPDLATPPIFFDTVDQFRQKTLSYMPSRGREDMLKAWGQYYETLGFHFTHNEMLVTTGGSEALLFAMAAIMDPGEEFIVFEPFYTNYQGFATLVGLNVVPVTLDIKNGFHLPSRAEIEAKITPKTKAMVICNPSNPTGTVYTRSELQVLVDIAKAHNLFLIADEVYREFSFDMKAESLLSFPEVSDRVIVIDSASKRWNVCGARMGLFASHNTEIVSAALKFAQARLSSPTLGQIGLIPLITETQKFVLPAVEEYRKRRDVVYNGLKAIPGVTVAKPEGAFYVIAGLPLYDNDAEKFAAFMIGEFSAQGVNGPETVFVAPAPGFYATPGKGKNEIRIAYVLEVPLLERVLALLKEAIVAYNKR